MKRTFTAAPPLFFLTMGLALCLCGCQRGSSEQASAPKGAAGSSSAATVKLTPVPSLRAARVAEGTIKIDGSLDDQGWAQTQSTGPFVQSPNGKPDPASPVNAEAKVAWDAKQLYVGFQVRDKAPFSPFSPQDQDPHVWERSSAVELMIQPGDPQNNKHYYEIQVDTAGAIWDTQFDDYNQPITVGSDPKSKRYGHQSWTSHLQKGISIDKKAGIYVIELAIPFSALKSPQAAVPPKPGDSWRINLYTFRDGQRQTMAWSPILRQGNFHKASRFGRVTFVSAAP